MRAATLNWHFADNEISAAELRAGQALLVCSSLIG